MIPIASFPTAVFAHLAAERLKAEGLTVRIEGADLNSLVPLGHSEVRVLVDIDDVPRARAILEDSEGDPGSPASPGAIGRSETSIRPKVFAFAMTVVSIMLGIRLYQVNSIFVNAFRDESSGPPYAEGRCLIYPWKDREALAFASCDLDGDGRPETTRDYSLAGVLEFESRDPDGDGSPNDVAGFDIRGVIGTRSIDADSDGIFELLIEFNRAGLESGRHFDIDADGRFERSVIVDESGNVTTWTDRSGDGMVDTLERRTPSGELQQHLTETSNGWLPVE